MVGILFLLGCVLIVRNGFIYTITAYIYAYRLTFCSVLPCV